MTAVTLQESLLFKSQRKGSDATDGVCLASASACPGVSVVRSRAVGPFLVVGATMRKTASTLAAAVEGKQQQPESRKVPYFLVYYIGRDDRDTMLRPDDAGCQPPNDVVNDAPQTPEANQQGPAMQSETSSGEANEGE
jgi:hypothetical protein